MPFPVVRAARQSQVKHKPVVASSPLCAGVRPVEDGGEKEVEALPGALANADGAVGIDPKGRTSITGGTYAAAAGRVTSGNAESALFNAVSETWK